MNGGISEALEALAERYGRATTQKDRDAIWQEIVRVSYKQERDREGAHRRDTCQGVFEASMLSLDEHIAKFDDPSKIATFSDWGEGAESIRNGGAELPEDVLEDALGRLSERDRAFAQAVLDGKRWKDLNITKQGFNWKIREVVKKITFHPPQNPSL